MCISHLVNLIDWPFMALQEDEAPIPPYASPTPRIHLLFTHKHWCFSESLPCCVCYPTKGGCPVCCIIHVKCLPFTQVMYPFKWARVVHHMPLLMTLTLPFIQRQALWKGPVPRLVAALAVETLAAVMSMAGALASCTFVAVLRVAVLGKHILPPTLCNVYTLARRWWQPGSLLGAANHAPASFSCRICKCMAICWPVRGVHAPCSCEVQASRQM